MGTVKSPSVSLFEPVVLGPIRLRNRIIKAATFEGMCPNGYPSQQLVDHHVRIAEGGAAMTTVAYASVAPDGRSYATQLSLQPQVLKPLCSLTEAVHKAGAAVSIQIGHCGYFADKKVIAGRPLAPSRLWNAYGLSFSRPMTTDDMDRVIQNFVEAAQLAVQAGFDAIEIHAGHGYLLSQFLSPFTNRRTDSWGGSLENRLRFPANVVQRVCGAVDGRAAVLVKTNIEDGFVGGLQVAEARQVCARFASVGADALVLSGGFVSKTPLYMLRGDVPWKAMVRGERDLVRKIGLALFGKLFVQEYPFGPGFFLDAAEEIRSAVAIPLVALGGIASRETAQDALDRGFEFVGMARALLHNPNFVNALRSDALDVSGCIPCNRCIAEMDRGGVRCVRPHASTQDEDTQ